MGRDVDGRVHPLLLTKLAFLIVVKQNLKQGQKPDLVSDHDLTQKVLEHELDSRTQISI